MKYLYLMNKLFENRYIWSIDGTLTGNISPGQMDFRLMAIKGRFTHPRSAELERHHQMPFSALPWALLSLIVSPSEGYS